MKSSMKIIRKLPDVQRPATKAQLRADVVGDGRYTRVLEHPERAMHLTPGKWTRSKPKAKEQKTPRDPKPPAKKTDNMKLVVELYDKGYTTPQIMEETGLTRGTVNRYIRNERGLRYRSFGQHDKEIIEMYNNRLSYKEMCTKLNVPDHYIRNMIRRLRSEGRIGWRNKKWEQKFLE